MLAWTVSSRWQPHPTSDGSPARSAPCREGSCKEPVETAAIPARDATCADAAFWNEVIWAATGRRKAVPANWSPRVIRDEMSLVMTGGRHRVSRANPPHAAFRTRARLVARQLARTRRIRKWRGTLQEIDVELRCRRNSLATAISRTPAHSPATRDRATNTMRYRGSCP